MFLYILTAAKNKSISIQALMKKNGFHVLKTTPNITSPSFVLSLVYRFLGLCKNLSEVIDLAIRASQCVGGAEISVCLPLSRTESSPS